MAGEGKARAASTARNRDQDTARNRDQNEARKEAREDVPDPPVEANLAEGLSHQERERVREATPPRAAVVYEIIRAKGEMELRRPVSALWWSGVVAGVSIGFSFVTQAALAANLPDVEWAEAVSRLGYAVGFLIVILGHQQLFTENVLTAVLPVISHARLTWLGRMLRLWAVVLAANVAGCAILAWFLARVPVLGAEVTREMDEIVAHLMANSQYEMFVKAIGSGWMIAALVWVLSASEGAEFFIITVVTYLIALFGLTHIVAGSVEVVYGYLKGINTAEQALVGFFLPTLAGNVFGGTVLFSVLSYAQVREEISLAEADR